MSKKILLDFDEEPEYSIIGISTGMKDYKLVFQLNADLAFNLKWADSFPFKIKDEHFLFSTYTYIDEQNMLNYYLVSNKSNAVNLVKQFKQFDYLMILDGEIDLDFANELSKKINLISGILITSVLDGEKITKIKNLRTELDSHLDKILK